MFGQDRIYVFSSNILITIWTLAPLHWNCFSNKTNVWTFFGFFALLKRTFLFEQQETPTLFESVGLYYNYYCTTTTGFKKEEEE